MTTPFEPPKTMKSRGNGKQALLVTLGHRGSFYVTDKDEEFVFVKPVASLDPELVVDCTAAGRSFRSFRRKQSYEGDTITRQKWRLLPRVVR